FAVRNISVGIMNRKLKAKLSILNIHIEGLAQIVCPSE
ncbi:MAG: hypothetical protein ACI85B_000365, partial [Flavobacteriaceae bacterium]